MRADRLQALRRPRCPVPLNTLCKAGATTQVTALLDRDPAAHVSLGDAVTPDTALLYSALAGRERERSLIDRNAPRFVGPGYAAVAQLLDTLHKAGARVQAAKLTERLPAVGLFELSRRHASREDQFWFGREADGRPAKPWAWADLG